MTAGTGYRYLMQTVVAGDGARAASTPLTRYYAEAGTPPGRWVGAGLAGLAGGTGVAEGSLVSEDQLFRLLGLAADPVTGEPLGAAPKTSGSASAGKPVAGFDVTFSVPKSVSAVWAVADAHTQELIARAHHHAVRDAVRWAERNVFATRTGRGGAHQVSVRGVVAAEFDHFDSRANDPHLHTHLVVANRVQAESDDKWRTLDSRAIFRATVALSELHQGLLMDRVSELLGVGWDGRARRHSPVPQWEITGVPDSLREEFSRRSGDINTVKDELVAGFIAAHGRAPDTATLLKLRQQATLQSRPDKHPRSLGELTAEWRTRAAAHLPTDVASWVRGLPQPWSRARSSKAFDAADVQRVAEQALTAVATKRATFTRWNVYAETQRQLQPVRFASGADRQTVGDRVTDAALGLAVLACGAPEPEACRRSDADRFTTREILDAEARLLEAGRAVEPGLSAIAGASSEVDLTAEQTEAVERIATSGRRLDVLVGAAGTGKTTAMAALAAHWQAAFGEGSVVGLAPSATAADALGRSLGMPTENTAKWLVENDILPRRLAQLDQVDAALRRVPRGAASHRRLSLARQELANGIDRSRLRLNQLVIIDEASLAGTRSLDQIVQRAGDAGAKVLLVGDWAQLGSVEAGGAFGLLVRDRDDVPELTDVRRFENEWELDASRNLRIGRPSAVILYASHGRIHEGDRGKIMETAYQRWKRDRAAGRDAILIAADNGTVTDLNRKARIERVLAGEVKPNGVALAGGLTAGVGDVIVARRNDRSLRTSDGGWVKNGDRWIVRSVSAKGAIEAVFVNGSATARLPAEYVTAHLDLGYATTVHRAQGQTVDTAHAVIAGPGMTRESLYVALTRARSENHAYVAVDAESDAATAHGRPERRSAAEVLAELVSSDNTAIQPATQIVRDGGNRERASVSAPLVTQPTDHRVLLSSSGLGR